MLRYEIGDIVNGSYPLFCQQVNCKGKMGAGLAKQIRDKYPEVYESYMRDYHLGFNKLGETLLVLTQDKRVCFNMYAQYEYGRSKRYTDYNAFKLCLEKISRMLATHKIDEPIAFPYGIGCGLAGGDWYIILGMLKDFSKTIKQDVIVVSLQ